MKHLLRSIKEMKDQGGFSLLEVIVAMGILIILVVGGILTYSGINQNSKKAAVQQAAKGVYTAAVANQVDGDGETTAQSAAQEYNDSQNTTVTVDGSERPMVFTEVEEFDDGGMKVTATYGDDEAVHVIDTSSGGEPIDDPNEGSEDPSAAKLSFTYQCDVDTHGYLPALNATPGTVVTLKGSDGSEEIVPYKNEKVVAVWDHEWESDDIPLSTTDDFLWVEGLLPEITNYPEPVTLKSGVEYEVFIDGSYQMFDHLLTYNNYDGITGCLKSISEFSDGVEVIGKITNDSSHMIDLPKEIPSSVAILGATFSNSQVVDPDIANWNVSNVNYMGFLFFAATSDGGHLSNWDVSNVTSMEYMFDGVNRTTLSPVTVDTDFTRWDTSNVTTMEYMFYGAIVSGDISDLDTSNVTTLRGTFSGTVFTGPESYRDISGWKVNMERPGYSLGNTIGEPQWLN